MLKRPEILSMFAVVLLAAGCQSPPSGAASAEGGVAAAPTPMAAKPSEVSTQAYANFAYAVLLHARSDRLLGQARGLTLTERPPTAAERREFHRQATELWNEAVLHYQRTLVFDTKSVAACNQLAEGYFDRGDTERGIYWLERAVTRDNDDFMLAYHLGLRCERARRPADAVKAYARAEQARTDDDKRRLLPLVLLKLGSLYETLERFDDAVGAYERFLKLKREPDEVYENNTALIELLDNRAPVHRKLGEVYARLGRHRQAAEAFQEAYRLQPGMHRGLLKLAAAYSDAGDYVRAEATCKEYIEKQPNRLDGMALLIEIYRKTGRLDRAVASAEAFLKEKPFLYQLHYLLGNLHEEMGDMEKAVSAYERIVSDRKQFLPAYLKLVDIEAKRGRLAKALAVLCRGLSVSPEDERLYVELDRRIVEAAKEADAATRFRLAVDQADHDFAFYYVLGRLAQESKKADEAVSAYREVIRLSPDFVHGYVRLASVYIGERKPAEAVKVLKTASEREPSNILVWRFLAEAQFAADDLTGAVDSMKRVVYLNPSSTANTLFLLGLMNRAGKTDEAERFLEQSLEKHPEEAERWTGMLAQFHIDHTQKLDRAVELLKDALKEHPESRELTATLGEAYLKQRDYPQAVRALRRAVEIEPEHIGTRIYLALALERDNKLAEAERELRELVKTDSKSDALLIELGRFLVRTKRSPVEGVALIQQTVARNPHEPSNRLALGGVYLHLKRYPDAVDVFTKLLEENPDDVLARYQLAIAYDEMDRFDDAERELRRILREDPTDAPAANALGYMYAVHNVKLDEAQKLVEVALKDEPDNGAYLDSMGWVLYRKGDLPGALEYLKKAIAQEPDAVIAEHLGDVYTRLGQKDLALERYEQAVKIDPENDAAAKKVKLLKDGKDPLVDGK